MPFPRRAFTGFVLKDHVYDAGPFFWTNWNGIIQKNLALYLTKMDPVHFISKLTLTVDVKKLLDQFPMTIYLANPFVFTTQRIS